MIDNFSLGVRALGEVLVLFGSGIAFVLTISTCYCFIYNRIKYGSVWGEDGIKGD